jgi:hypothetical protein
VHAAFAGKDTENWVVDPPVDNGFSDGSVMVAVPFSVEAYAGTVHTEYADPISAALAANSPNFRIFIVVVPFLGLGVDRVSCCPAW